MSEKTRGFTLIELMIVVAVIGILATVAVQNFIAYRNKSRVASGIATASSIRTSFAGYASSSATNAFPMTTDLPDWASIALLCNMHGASLDASMQKQGFSFFVYHGVSVAGSLDACDNTASGNECADICIVFRINGVPGNIKGSQLEVRSSGIVRQTY